MSTNVKIITAEDNISQALKATLDGMHNTLKICNDTTGNIKGGACFYPLGLDLVETCQDVISAVFLTITITITGHVIDEKTHRFTREGLCSPPVAV